MLDSVVMADLTAGRAQHLILREGAVAVAAGQLILRSLMVPTSWPQMEVGEQAAREAAVAVALVDLLGSPTMK
jgi:hypothetical protein